MSANDFQLFDGIDSRLSATDFLLSPQELDDEDDELEQNLEKLVRIKSREELEQVYGVPVIVSVLHHMILRPLSDKKLAS